MSSSSSAPIDAAALRRLLDSMGVESYEPRVLHQLLEYMQTYLTEVFKDGEHYAEHAGRPGQIECEDVQLAARLKAASTRTHNPRLMDWMARDRNRTKLVAPPSDKISLPNPRLCVVEENYQLQPPRLVETSATGDEGNAPPSGRDVVPTAGGASGPVSFSLQAPARRPMQQQQQSAPMDTE